MIVDKHSWDRAPTLDGDKRQWKRHVRDVEVELEIEKDDVDISGRSLAVPFDRFSSEPRSDHPIQPNLTLKLRSWTPGPLVTEYIFSRFLPLVLCAVRDV